MTTDIDISFQEPVILGFNPKQFAKKVAKLKSIKTAQIDITFVDSKTIHNINKKHLNHDYVTDIITFNLGDTTSPIGDIYICVQQAKENAETFKTTLDNEIKLLITHGILHLLGFRDYTDSEKANMDAEQNRLLEQITNEK